MKCSKCEIGNLKKLKSYYVCDNCCTDTVSFEDIVQIMAKDRNAFPEKPSGRCVHIKDPEYAGYYKYKKEINSEWITTYRLTGLDGSSPGVIIHSDYSKSEFIKANTPKYMAHLKTGDYVSTVTVNEEEIEFVN